MVRRIATAGIIGGIIFIISSCASKDPGLQVNEKDLSLETVSEREFSTAIRAFEPSKETLDLVKQRLDSITTLDELRELIDMIKENYSQKYLDLILDDADVLASIKRGIGKYYVQSSTENQ